MSDRVIPCQSTVQPTFVIIAVSISLGKNSSLIIDGDFTIGNGTRIFLDEGAFLYIGGNKYESASGITEKSRVMVRKSVHIGVDCIIAWNVFITDCDWHEIEGKSFQEDVRSYRKSCVDRRQHLDSERREDR